VEQLAEGVIVSQIFEKEFANVLFFKTRDISSKSMPLLHYRSKRLACETGAAEHRDTASNTIDSNRLRLQSQQTKDG